MTQLTLEEVIEAETAREEAPARDLSFAVTAW